MGGRFEEGDTCVGTGRHGDAESSPGGAGPVHRLGINRGLQSFRKVAEGFLSDLAMSVSGFLEVVLVGAGGIRYPGKTTSLQASRPLPIPLCVGVSSLSGLEEGQACARQLPREDFYYKSTQKRPDPPEITCAAASNS